MLASRSVNRLFFGCISCAVLLSGAARATTLPGGPIIADETWDLAGSPYVVAGDITVQNGATLVIEPGVEVRFAQTDASNGGVDAQRIELTIQGALRALGNSAQPIWFHVDSEADAEVFANSWYGIVLDREATSAQLDHVTIEAANNAVSSAAPDAMLTVSHTTLSHNNSGVWLTAGQALLDGVLATNNAISGVSAAADTNPTTLSVQNSVLRLNGSYGVSLLAAQGHELLATIASSTIYGNTSVGVRTRANGEGSRAHVDVVGTIVASNGIVGLDSAGTEDGTTAVTTTYSDLWSNGEALIGSVAGAGCIAADPLFQDAPADLRLTSGSPCIAAAGPVGPALDLLEKTRATGAGFDIGAYEYIANDEPAAGAANEEPAADAVDDVPATRGINDATGCSCKLACPTTSSTSSWQACLLVFAGLAMMVSRAWSSRRPAFCRPARRPSATYRRPHQRRHP